MDQEIILMGGNSKLDSIIINKITELEAANKQLPLIEIKKRIGENNKNDIRDFYNSLCTKKMLL